MPSVLLMSRVISARLLLELDDLTQFWPQLGAQKHDRSSQAAMFGSRRRKTFERCIECGKERTHFGSTQGDLFGQVNECFAVDGCADTMGARALLH